jgi:hypothetical protein
MKTNYDKKIESHLWIWTTSLSSKAKKELSAFDMLTLKGYIQHIVNDVVKDCSSKEFQQQLRYDI